MLVGRRLLWGILARGGPAVARTGRAVSSARAGRATVSSLGNQIHCVYLWPWMSVRELLRGPRSIWSGARSLTLLVVMLHAELVKGRGHVPGGSCLPFKVHRALCRPLVHLCRVHQGCATDEEVRTWRRKAGWRRSEVLFGNDKHPQPWQRTD